MHWGPGSVVVLIRQHAKPQWLMSSRQEISEIYYYNWEMMFVTEKQMAEIVDLEVELLLVERLIRRF